jgi:hypothetical protein
MRFRYGGPKEMLEGRNKRGRYPHGDEVYNAVAVFEALGVTGDPAVNDDEGPELGWFRPDLPIPELNPTAGLILRKAGYVTERS